MRWRDLTLSQILNIGLGLIQWSVAIVSVVGTLALFGWIVRMIIKKDKRNELN
jgi:hypothetical protein